MRLVEEHRAEYASLTAAAEAVAKQLGVGKESVRRWVLQADVDAGRREGVMSEESAEIEALEAENRRLSNTVNLVVRSTSVPIADLSRPMIRSPSQ